MRKRVDLITSVMQINAYVHFIEWEHMLIVIEMIKKTLNFKLIVFMALRDAGTSEACFRFVGYWCICITTQLMQDFRREMCV